MENSLKQTALKEDVLTKHWSN